MFARQHNEPPVGAGEQLMQLDQAITLTLQEIDENFSHAHQTVTSRILPAIRQYEASCSKTWQGARFWKHFFEASAQVSLSQQPLADVDGSFPDTGAQSFDDPKPDSSATRDSDMQSPPRLSHSVYAGASPSQDGAAESQFERLKRDVELSHADLTVERSADHIPSASSPVQRERRASARPRLSVVHGSDTPDRPRLRGDGIADLRHTPLRGRAHGMDQGEDDSLAWPDDMSPPVTVQMSVPRSRHSIAPQPSARLVDDVLRSAESARDRSARRQSVVGTPLVRRGRRDSLPTPPTITKVQAPPSGNTSGKSAAARLMDEDEGLGMEPEAVGVRPSPRVSLIPGAIERMLESDEESDDDDSDDDEVPPPPPPGHTGPLRAPDGGHSHSSAGITSRSIEDDTLFGVRT